MSDSALDRIQQHIQAGNQAREQRNLSSAMASFQQALELGRSTNSSRGIGDALLALANFAMERQQAREALEYLRECIQHYRQSKFGLGLAHALRLQGQAQEELGEFDQALAAYNESLQFYSTSERQESRIAQVLSYLGNVAYHQQRFSEAFAPYLNSMQIWERLGNKREVASILLVLGICAMQENDIEHALLCLSGSLGVSRRAKDDEGYKYARQQLQQIIQALQPLGERAREAVTFAQRIAEDSDSGDPQRWTNLIQRTADMLNQLGDVSRAQKAYIRAQIVFNEALTLWRELELPEQIALALRNVGMMAEVQQNPRYAADCYSEALDLCRRIGQREGEAVTLRDLGDIAAVLKQFKDASNYYTASIRTWNELGETEEAADTQKKLAQLPPQVG